MTYSIYIWSTHFYVCHEMEIYTEFLDLLQIYSFLPSWYLYVFYEKKIFMKFPWPSSLGIERFLIGHAWDPIPRYEVRSWEDTSCTVWPKWKCFGIKIRFDLPQRPGNGHGGGSSVEKFYVTYMQNLMKNREKSQSFLSFRHSMVKFHSFIDDYV